MSYWNCPACGRIAAPKRARRGDQDNHPVCPRCRRVVARILEPGDRPGRPIGKQRRNKLAAVIERDGPRCRWCGTEADPTLDHVVPLARGGTNAVDNLQVLCADCNQLKGDRDFTDVAA